MTDPQSFFQAHANAVQELLGEAGSIAVDAAQRRDAGSYGCAECSSTMQQLVNLGVQSYVSFLQGLVAGPFAEPIGEPLPSEDITVDPDGYDRRLTVAETFKRVGLPVKNVPDNVIGFLPEVLPANETRFRIYLKNYEFIGANYTGKVRLTRTTTAVGLMRADTISVIVGL